MRDLNSLASNSDGWWDCEPWLWSSILCSKVVFGLNFIRNILQLILCLEIFSNLILKNIWIYLYHSLGWFLKSSNVKCLKAISEYPFVIIIINIRKVTQWFLIFFIISKKNHHFIKSVLLLPLTGRVKLWLWLLLNTNTVSNHNNSKGVCGNLVQSLDEKSSKVHAAPFLTDM